MHQQLHRLVRPTPAIAPEIACGSVWKVFADNPDLLTLAIVDEKCAPLGIVNRHDFLVAMSHMFGNALYGKRPISALMDADPLIVDVAEDAENLAKKIIRDKPSALLKGFVITDNVRYLGVGTALSLLQLIMRDTEARAHELEIATERAEQASQVKSNFLAQMSHELRTPLNAIIGFADVIRLESFGPAPPRYRDYADDIFLSGQHLLEIINDLLDLTKVESGRFELHEEPVELSHAIKTATGMMMERADKEGVRLDSDLPGGLRQIFADKRMVRQMLINLISNAIKFTPRGGDVTVGVAAERDGAIRLFVSDTGIGIAPEDIPRVLEPFVQVDNGLARKYEGSGLGLSLVKSFAKLHGGSLDIASSPGRGTKVSIIFPSSRVLTRAA